MPIFQVIVKRYGCVLGFLYQKIYTNHKSSVYLLTLLYIYRVTDDVPSLLQVSGDSVGTNNPPLYYALCDGADVSFYSISEENVPLNSRRTKGGRSHSKRMKQWVQLFFLYHELKVVIVPVQRQEENMSYPCLSHKYSIFSLFIFKSLLILSNTSSFLCIWRSPEMEENNYNRTYFDIQDAAIYWSKLVPLTSSSYRLQWPEVLVSLLPVWYQRSSPYYWTRIGVQLYCVMALGCQRETSVRKMDRSSLVGPDR